MYHDGVGFVVVCLLTRGTLDLPLPVAWRLAGAALVALGVSVKIWAAATLGADGYYWRGFFGPPNPPGPPPAPPHPRGPDPLFTPGSPPTPRPAVLGGP